MERIDVNMKNEIKICPFRTYTEVRPAIMQGQGDVTVTGFMECLKEDCPAFYKSVGIIPNTNNYRSVERCKRLE